MKKYKLMEGDNIESLKKIPDNSIDSVVTDPPYGLSFMQKKWDYDVPSVEFWKEVYRVLKPGGHVLSFGGTRTYHRMVVNMEDGGFEIRDQIMWLYGSGFPKSLNVGKAIDKLEGNERKVVGVLENYQDKRGLNGQTENVMENAKPRIDLPITKGQSPYEGWGTALKPANEPICLARKPLSEKTIAKNVLKWGTGGINIDGCRIGYTSEVDKESAKPGSLNATGDNSMFGLKSGNEQNEGGRFPANIILECICDEVIKGEKGEVIEHNGGTALKPANEPICLARKPLSEKTVAKNVLKWGTGGININGCRVGSEGGTKAINFGENKGDVYGGGKGKPTNDIQNINEGRFPANIILECICDEVIKGEKGELKEFNRKDSGSIYGNGKGLGDVNGHYISGDKGDIHTNPKCPCRLLDEQSGVSKSNPRIAPKESIKDPSSYNTGAGGNSFLNDSGGASRFFYQAKVSKKERNMGLDGFEDKENPSIGSTYAGNQTTSKIGGKPDKPTEPKKNNHPTVKPVNLMAYLCRLITPPGGIVLDPFIGSGSTGIAARLEGFRFVGMEMDPEYIKIADARIKDFEKYREFIK